ncbi:hypothetical protein MDAP_001026 [Mitosporidium daphniae]|uniref:Uncharacterized protein n=1 Tax=Mitosporidium daphniae TaxID=1485682 RepID=A0A098VR00_9MICR|nr:uncharacterized protein DI09_35p300 [Mitosporidium daphniae]KGG51442.1 hypothetical protein DI09_35p300 [Mitosporidium daphniae]|eukprot:XP_013237869.1 uncharacterized protein DI09_35p300 [Mitosporidium daphniae]
MVSPLSVSPDTPTYIAFILNFTIGFCNYIRFSAVNLIGSELENISDWLLRIFQLTDNSPQYVINVCQVFYLLCALVKCVQNSWSNHKSTLDSLENSRHHGISAIVPRVLKNHQAQKKPFTPYDKLVHTLRLVFGIAFALALQTGIPSVILEAYSANPIDAFADEDLYFERFFSISKYSAFLLANTASSIFWLWASCLYVCPDVPFKIVVVPVVYMIKVILFFVVRRIFRNCWNPDASNVGSYVQLYLSPYTAYPCILFSFGMLVLIAGVIGTPDPAITGRIKIPSIFLFIVLSSLSGILISNINFLPKMLFELLRSDISSSGSYVLALHFFPFNYNGNLSSFAFCMLTFLMFMETGARSASSSFKTPVNSWGEAFQEIYKYLMCVSSVISSVERYPISVIAAAFYLIKPFKITLPSVNSE